MLTYPESDRVTEIASCKLFVGPSEWPYAHAHRDAIDAHWQRVSAANPKYFNGTIHLVDTLTVAGGTLTARFTAAEFKSFLYWRAAGYPPAGVRDGFGSALLVSSDGAYVLGRQSSGNINAGLAYLPGGFIDRRDVDASGTIDITASIVREVLEETGLDPADFSLRPGFLLTEQGAQLSIAKCIDVALEADALAARIERHIASEANPELASAVIVRTLADLDGLAMPPFARLLLTRLLTYGSGAR
jgi:8-oxo-dGTP pyrophosphatase MutT (NUDIX family)